MPKSSPGKYRVLVVDDRDDSRYLICACLRAGGFTVADLSEGKSVMDFVEREMPELIVLDVHMPEMDGFEVCRLLRSNPATCHVPVLLVTAAIDHQIVSTGFAAGAVDFVPKPFRPEELCARAKVHAELSRARRDLEQSHARLAELNREKDLMFRMVAHDLRGPISVIAGFSEHASRRETAKTDPVIRQAFEITMRETGQMDWILSGLQDLDGLERGAVRLVPRALDLAMEARRAVERASPAAEFKALDIRFINPMDRTVVRADESGVRRLLDNLISNALKFTQSGGCVRIRARHVGAEVECQVSDSGPGLSEEDMVRVFGRFARLSAQPTAGEKSTGLGLAICRALAESMGGRIWCGNNFEGGAYFTFALPVGPADEDRGDGAPLLQGGSGGTGDSMAPFAKTICSTTYSAT